MFSKIGILILQILQEKQLRWSLFLRKLGPLACNFIKNRIQQRRFPLKCSAF